MKENKSFCSNCGKEIDSNGKFCSFCGVELDDINECYEKPRNNNQSISKPSFGWVIIVMSIISSILVLGFLILPQQNRSDISIFLILIGFIGYFISGNYGKMELEYQKSAYLDGVDLGIEDNEELMRVIKSAYFKNVIKVWNSRSGIKIQTKKYIHCFYIDDGLVKIDTPPASFLKNISYATQAKKMSEANSIMDELVSWTKKSTVQNTILYYDAGKSHMILLPTFSSIIIGIVLLLISITDINNISQNDPLLYTIVEAYNNDKETIETTETVKEISPYSETYSEMKTLACYYLTSLISADKESLRNAISKENPDLVRSGNLMSFYVKDYDNVDVIVYSGNNEGEYMICITYDMYLYESDKVFPAYELLYVKTNYAKIPYIDDELLAIHDGNYYNSISNLLDNKKVKFGEWIFGNYTLSKKLTKIESQENKLMNEDTIIKDFMKSCYSDH